MTAELSGLRGSNMNAVVASTLRFVPFVESVGCTWVVLFLTCSWSTAGLLSNPSVVTPSSLSMHNICCFSSRSLGLVSRNAEWLNVHFHNLNPAVLSRHDISCCNLTASSGLKCHLVYHQYRNHCSTFEQNLDIETSCHLLNSWCNMLSDMELKIFHMSQR